MRFWKLRLALASAAAAGLALAVALLVPRSVTDGLLMIVIVAMLVGMYFLRRFARAELLYQRDAERGRPAPRTKSESVNQPSAPDPRLSAPPQTPADKTRNDRTGTPSSMAVTHMSPRRASSPNNQ